MSKFQEVLIGDVCSVGDGAHSKVKRIDDGVPYLTSKNIGQGNLKLDKLDFISEESFEKLFPKNSRATRRPQDGDVLFGIIGTFGNAYLYKESDHFGFSSSIGVLRPDPEKLYSEFLYYVVSSKAFKSNHANHNAGSVQGYTNISTVKSLPIPLPPLSEQKIIAKVLKSLDDKIQLNRQTNQTLEQIAQAIFKSWFVDFEPVKAKIAAKQNSQDPELAAICAISGKKEAQLKTLDTATLQQLKTTAALFPDALVESELGEVPEGWEIKPLSNIVNVIMGQSPKGDTYNDFGEGTPLVNGPVEFGSYHPKNIKWTTSPTKMSENKDLVVCVRGSTTGRFVKSDGEYCLGRGVCALRSEKYQPFVDYLYKSEMSNLLGLTTGSTFPSWSGPTLKNYIVIKPSDTVLDAFSKLVNGIEQKVSSAEKESESLSSLRDTLLPKLLSGEITLDNTPTREEVMA